MLSRKCYQLVVILAIFGALIPQSWAKNSTLIHCLAKEETHMHRNKLGGPLYQLNQTLINELTGLGDFDFVSPYKEMVCGKNEFPPSVAFIKVILEVGDKAIKIQFSQNATDGEKAFKTAIIKKLVEDAPHYFFTYISSIQSLAPSPNCLEKEVPGLKALLDKYFYLEEDVEAKDLITNKAQVTRIFNTLKNIDQIFKNCSPNKPAK
jgi:hypothetical protein